jgi:hypothetical protein
MHNSAREQGAHHSINTHSAATYIKQSLLWYHYMLKKLNHKDTDIYFYKQ